ncbi:MAG: hypothetical protein AAGD11_01485 [Planctomycetota bacterium]
MSQSRTFYAACVITSIGAAASLILQQATFAEQVGSPEKQPDITAYRRLFVPADAPEDWPTGSDRYLPLRSDQFAELVLESRKARNGKGPHLARIASGTYRATMRDADTLEIRAEFDVHFDGETPKVLSLSPLNLAIQSATWPQEKSREAKLGTWPVQDQSSAVAVRVERSAPLVVEGRLAARRPTSDRSDFYLETPAISRQQIELELPANLTVSVTGAELLRTDYGALGESRWLFQLAPAQRHRIRVRSAEQTTDSVTKPRIGHATTYRIKSVGLEAGSVYRFDSRLSKSIELRSVLPVGTRVIDVTVGGEASDWSVNDEQGQRTLTLSIKPSKQPQWMQVKYLAKFRSGTTWELPTLRFNDLQWKEGTTTLIVSPEVELQSLVPRNSTLQQIVGIDNLVPTSEVYRLLNWDDEATVEVVVARPQPRWTADTLTKYSVGRSKPQTTVTAVLSSARGEIHQIQALIHPGWNIDSIRAMPESKLGDWHLDRSGGSTKLFLHLRDPISEQQPLRLEVAASKSSRSPDFPVKVSDFLVLNFVETEAKSNLLALASENSKRLMLAEPLKKGLVSVQQLPTSMTSAGVDTLSIDADHLLDLSLLNDDTSIKFGRQPPVYSVDIDVQVEALPNAFDHEFQIVGRMQAGALPELLVESTVPLPDSLQWSLDEASVGIDVLRVSEKADVPAEREGARYLLKFSEPLTGDFRLSAQYSQKSAPIEICNLLQLPDTLNWTELLSVRGSPELLRVIEPRYTPSSRWPPGSKASRLPILGVYQLGPRDFRQAAHDATLRLERDNTQATTSEPIAWLGKYETLQGANGTALHSANYLLENRGTGVAKVAIPEGATLEEAWVNDRQLEVQLLASDSAGYLFRLPQNDLSHSLRLKYTTHDSRLGGAAQIRPRLPACSFPVNLHRWTLWAPEQYEIDATQQDYASTKNHWWKRMFGPLARSRSEAVFNPLSARRWGEVWSTPLVVQETKSQTGSLAGQLVTQIEENPKAKLSAVLKSLAIESQLDDLLLIDRAALISLGVDAQSLCDELAPNGYKDNPPVIGASSLSSYRLALLASARSILLTSPERVAHWRNQLRPTRVAGVYLASTDDLADSLDELHGSDSAFFVPASAWPDLPMPLDAARYASASITLADIGRQAETVEFCEALPTLVVRRAHVRQALWLAVLLLTIVVGVWQLAHFPNAMIFIAALAGACCLIVPINLLTIPQAVFLGLLAAAVVRIVVKSSRLGDLRRLEAAGRSQAILAVFVSTVVFFSMPGVGSADDAATSLPSRPLELPTILVPVDAFGRRQGEDVLVPEHFLSLLQELSARNHADERFVVRDAHYSAAFTTKPQDVNSSSVPPWTLSWKIETFYANCKVWLPLKQNDAQWLRAEHRLDGLPVEVDWHSDGDGCWVNVPETGTHSLKLVCHPIAIADGELRTIRLQVPPVAAAKVSVSTSPAHPAVTMPRAVRLADDSGTTDAEYLLGPADAIEMQWNAATDPVAADPWSRIEQLSWLRIASAESRLDVRLQVIGSKSDLQTIELDIAAPLRLRDTSISSPATAVSATPFGASTRLQLRLRPGLPPDFVIPLSFELQRATSVGRFSFPSVRVVGGTPQSRRFAISVAAGLSYDEEDIADMRIIDPEDFMAAWGEDPDEPLFAYAVGPQPTWELRVRPDPTSSTAQQSMQLYCRSNVVEVDFEAEVDQLAGARLVHRLQVPASVEIDTITIRNNLDQSIVSSRWSRTSDNTVSVFLNQPLTGSHLLRLSGHFDHDPVDEVTVPMIVLSSSDRGEVHLDLFRADDVQVRWDDPISAPQEIKDPRLPPQADEIHVGHYVWSTSLTGQLSKLRLRKNDLEFRTRSVTSIAQSASGWTTRLDSRIAVSNGVLSRLLISVPKNVQSPFELLSKQVGVLQEVPDTNQLLLTLAKPVSASGQVDIQLRGNLILPADRSLTVPSLFWENATRRSRYVLLPTLVNGETINWRRSGLRRQRLPLSIAELTTLTTSSHCYRVQREQFEATQVVTQGAMRNAQIRFACVTGTLEAGGLFTGHAELLIQPGRASYCTLRLPDGAQLQRLVVGDRAAQVDSSNNERIAVALGPPFLPQRLLISYQHRPKQTGSRVRLQPPAVLLGDQQLPMPDTFWRIRAVGNLLLSVPHQEQVVSRQEIARRSYQVPLEMMRDAFSQTLALPPSEGRAWTHTWRGIVQRAEQNWQQSGAYRKRDVGFEADRESLLAIEDALAVGSAADELTPLTYPARLPRAVESATLPTEYDFVSTANGQLVATMSLSSRYSAWQWLVASALVSGVLAVVLRLRNHPECYHNLCHWPHGLAIAGGMGWWLLLKPSALGLFVVALAVVSFALFQWRNRRSREAERRHVRYASTPT